MKWKEFIEKAKPFFTIDHDATVDIKELGGKAVQKLWRFIQIVLRTANGFAKNRQGYQAITLSYTGLMAFVPLLALVFAVTGGLGLTDEATWHYILSKISFLRDYPGLTDNIINYAMKLVDDAQSGWVGLVSGLIFGWAVIWFFFQIETIFNIVWKANGKRDRNIFVRFGWLIGMLILLPYVLVVFGSAFVFSTNAFKYLNFDLGDFNNFLPWLGLFVFATLTFSLMFKFIPEVRVKYSYSFFGSVVTSLCFTVFQYLYLMTQTFVTRLNSLYGVMAAIPLFLAWMKISWQIILYGANLVKALQDFNEGEEYAFKKG